MLISDPNSHIKSFVKNAKEIRNLIKAKEYMEVDWDEKMRVVEYYEDISKMIDDKIRDNAIIFEILSLVER